MTEQSCTRIRSFARAIAEQEIELLPGVAETLAGLSARHRLILMTKGNQAEQADKLSPLRTRAIFFRGGDRRREDTRPIAR